MDPNKVSANNSTPLRYLKKTWYSAITRVRIPSRIGGYNSTRVIFESEHIRACSNRAGIRASTEHDFGFSTQLRLKTFKTRLKNESRVGPPIRPNLIPKYLFLNSVLLRLSLNLRVVCTSILIGIFIRLGILSKLKSRQFIEKNNKIKIFNALKSEIFTTTKNCLTLTEHLRRVS